MIVIDIEQGSDEWHEERFRSITGTRLESALGAKFDKRSNKWVFGDKSKQNTLLLELVSELQSEIEIDDFTSYEMERGHTLEPITISLASKDLGVSFSRCGMLKSDTHKAFKFSPDAVCYGINGFIVGGCEAKAESGKTHVGYLLDDKVPNKHFWQCLCPMVMDDCVEWWAFASYDDRNHVKPLFVKVLERKDYEDLIQQAREELHNFMNLVRETVSKVGGYYNA